MIDKVLDYLDQFYGENILSVYGIGSYFDDSLPEDWIKNDIDVIVFVKNIEGMPSPYYSDSYFEKMSAWCHDRASTWNDFVLSCKQFEKYKNGEITIYRKIFNMISHESLIIIFSYIITQGKVDLTTYISLLLEMGKEVTIRVFNLENQTKMLIKSSQYYDMITNRIKIYYTYLDNIDKNNLEYRIK